MNLIPDNYGSETTWALTDENGTTVMSGGPYTNNNNTPITVTEQLCYGCYTLTVNDSYGDGICCRMERQLQLHRAMRHWSPREARSPPPMSRFLRRTDGHSGLY